MTDSTKDMPPSKPPLFPGAAILLALAFLAYFPVFRGEFIWDDEVLLTGNPLVKSAGGLLDIWFSSKPVDYVPLTLTSFWLEWRLWQANPLGYHLVNVLLHAAAATLLWRVLQRLRLQGAWLAAALFTVHPVAVASVAWISERKNTLSLVFCLLSFLWYLRWNECRVSGDGGERRSTGNWQWYWLSLAAFFLAVASKPSVVVLPVVLLVCSWWKRGRLTWPEASVRTVPFFILSLASAGIALWFQHRARAGGAIHSDPLLTRLVAGSWAVWFYLYKALLPINLAMIYPRWTVNPASSLSYLPALVWAASLVCFWLNRKRWGRSALFALACFTLALLPVLGLADMFYLTLSRVADQWAFLALLVVVAFAANLLSRLTHYGSRIPAAGPILCAGIVLTLGVLTRSRASVYASSQSLWQDTLRKNPGCWAAHNNLGMWLDDRARFNEAAGHYAAALQLNPDFPDGHNNWGVALFKQRRNAEAIAHFEAALSLDPRHAEARNNLGNVLLEKGDLAGAEGHYSEAVRLEPAFAKAWHNLGLVRAKQGRFDEAVSLYTRALELDPYLPEAHCNLADVLGSQNKIQEAILHYERALAARPEMAAVHERLGLLQVQQARFDAAAGHFEAALRIEPDRAASHRCLGDVHLFHHELALALPHYREALRLDPKAKDALNNCVWILATASDPKLRDPQQALALAQRLVEMTGGKEAGPLDTLAAAYAASGKFAEALETARKALNLAVAAKQAGLANEVRARIALYEAHQEFRE